MLRLPSIRNEFTWIAAIADREMRDQVTYHGGLAELPMAECDDRARRRSERQIEAAGFPREKPLRAFRSRPTRTLAKAFTDPRLCAAIVDRLGPCRFAVECLLASRAGHHHHSPRGQYVPHFGRRGGAQRGHDCPRPAGQRFQQIGSSVDRWETVLLPVQPA